MMATPPSRSSFKTQDPVFRLKSATAFSTSSLRPKLAVWVWAYQLVSRSWIAMAAAFGWIQIMSRARPSILRSSPAGDTGHSPHEANVRTWLEADIREAGQRGLLPARKQT